VTACGLPNRPVSGLAILEQGSRCVRLPISQADPHEGVQMAWQQWRWTHRPQKGRMLTVAGAAQVGAYRLRDNIWNADQALPVSRLTAQSAAPIRAEL